MPPSWMKYLRRIVHRKGLWYFCGHVDFYISLKTASNFGSIWWVLQGGANDLIFDHRQSSVIYAGSFLSVPSVISKQSYFRSPLQLDHTIVSYGIVNLAMNFIFVSNFFQAAIIFLRHFTSDKCLNGERPAGILIEPRLKRVVTWLQRSTKRRVEPLWLASISKKQHRKWLHHKIYRCVVGIPRWRLILLNHHITPFYETC